MSGFLPFDIWHPQALEALRANLVMVNGAHPDPATVQAWREAARARQDAVQERLGYAEKALRPIIALHSPNRWDECTGCDFGGREGDLPDWPCRTINLILEGLEP